MITEDQLEQQTLAWFKELGWEYRYGPDIAPDSDTPARTTWQDTILADRLREALARINPGIPSIVLDEAVHVLSKPELPTLVKNNRQYQTFVTDGIPVQWEGEDRTIGDRVQLFDFQHIENNDWLVVNQFTVIGSQKRRPDIVVFINGLPIAVLELKNPADEQATVWKAFDQLQTYKDEIPDLFVSNTALIISDGVTARIGSLTASPERFQPWRTVESEHDKPLFELELETLTKGFFSKGLLLDFLRSFVLFEEDGSKIIKKIAAYHQFHAVREAVRQTVTSTQVSGDGRCGVVWHTQGSGKSISMCCYAAKVMAHPDMNNPTIVVVTDRNDLDGQLYQTFCNARSLLRETPLQAEDRTELRKLLASRPAGGIIFTTIQKFSPRDDEVHFPRLSDRHNIVVISDEAHRSQYGLKARVQRNKKGETARIVYGYAKHLRDALPNAGFIGFTGTPVAMEDRDTRQVFGNYISIYDIAQAVQDKATVQIYYESRLAELHLEAREDDLDEDIDSVMEDHPDYYAEKQKAKWSALTKLVTAGPRVKQVAQDLVHHWENRQAAMCGGKAMIVCISREACVQMYDALIELKPEWAGDIVQSGKSADSLIKPDPDTGAVRVVMTGSASDSETLALPCL